MRTVFRTVAMMLVAVRPDRTEKQTWRISVFKVSTTPFTAVEWRSTSKKVIEAPRSAPVLIAPDALDAIWLLMLRPETAIAAVTPTGTLSK